jgi:hypothetical protein
VNGLFFGIGSKSGLMTAEDIGELQAKIRVLNRVTMRTWTIRVLAVNDEAEIDDAASEGHSLDIFQEDQEFGSIFLGWDSLF